MAVEPESGRGVKVADGFGHEKSGGGLTNDWITPKWLLDRLGKFDLDPCESNTQPWPCATRGYRLCRGEDGLALPWEGMVYCNPPYGKHTRHWIQRCRDYGNAIMLIFARTETQAFWDIWTGAHGILFMKRRVSFYLPDGSKAASGTAPSCLVAFGKEAAERLLYARVHGAYIYERWSCYDEDSEAQETGEADAEGSPLVGREPPLLFGAGQDGDAGR